LVSFIDDGDDENCLYNVVDGVRHSIQLKYLSVLIMVVTFEEEEEVHLLLFLVGDIFYFSCSWIGPTNNTSASKKNAT
jgi:hypothetical protein